MMLAKTHASQEEVVGHCSHLGIEEREDVMLLARQHKGVREIARTAGRDKPAVSRELARAWQIQERFGIPVCFCAPRYPWEKGTNRNASGLLRLPPEGQEPGWRG
jgi:IS30 family transposase